MEILNSMKTFIADNQSTLLLVVFLLLSISYYGYILTVSEPLAVPVKEAGKSMKSSKSVKAMVTEDEGSDAEVSKPVSPKKGSTSKSPSRGPSKNPKARSSSPKVSSNTSSKSKSRKVVPKYTVGNMVMVEPYDEPGQKMKDGGVAKITKSYIEDSEVFYAVSYVLGGKESSVEEEYISLQEYEDTSKRGRAPSRKVAENSSNNKQKKPSRSSNSRSRSTGRKR